MSDDEVIGTVRLAFAIGLKPWDDPTAYSFPVRGEIVACLDVPDDPHAVETAGRIGLTVIKFTEAYNDDVELADVFYEAGLPDVYSTFFDKEEDFKKPLDNRILPGDIVFIESVTLEPKFSRTRLLVQTVESIIPSFSSLSLTIARKTTLDHGQREWLQLGFELTEGSEFVYRDNVELDPRRKAY